MALWKPFRGNRAGLDSVEKHDGYVYFCIDDGTLFFDYTDADGVLQRKQINAKYAEALIGTSSDGITESTIVPSTRVTHGTDSLSDILETYILNIDYDTLLAFDTSELVSGGSINTTAILGQATLDSLILA